MIPFAVVLEMDAPLPVLEIGPSIARAIRRPLADVTRALRRSRGVIDLDLTEAEAEAVAAVVEEVVGKSKVVARADLPTLPPPTSIVDADPTSGGLLIQAAATGAPEQLPWRRLEILAVGLVTFTVEKAEGPIAGGEDIADDLLTVIAGGSLGWVGPAGYTSRAPTFPDPPRPRTETVHVMDLVTGVPTDRYRIVASKFVYDYLGDRLALASTANFRTLVLDISRLSPETLLTGSTLSYLEGAKPGTHRFDQAEEFEGYVRWISAWRQVWE